MGEWGEALLFGLVVIAFVLGLSSIIMGFIHQPQKDQSALAGKIEFGFFGVAGLVVSAVLTYGLSSI
ncbi:hypothetical protein EYS14_23340 [Alteromonadaceae bacterium M269]|nr:hypothetical protein EYS14_23340 [Alteromonadaceae bacterium M269]